MVWGWVTKKRIGLHRLDVNVDLLEEPQRIHWSSSSGPVAIKHAGDWHHLQSHRFGNYQLLAELDGKIVKQNADSRVQPVSSLQWASILMAMKDESGGPLGFDAAMDAYNQHPEVRAMSDKTDESGAGSIALDRRRKLAVKNWLERTCPDAFAIVEASTHDLAFSLGPFGETIASYQFLFLGSTTTGLAPNLACELHPLDHEAFVPIDYKLPMNDLGQTILFKRIQSTFDRETTLVSAAHKKKYRLGKRT